MAALRDWSDESPSLPGWQEHLGELETGLFVADTCVYLDLYRLRGPAEEELAAALRFIRDQLCVPYQVHVELADKSRTIVDSIVKETEDTSAEVDGLRGNLELTVRRLLRRTSDPGRRGILAMRTVNQSIRALQETLWPDSGSVQAALGQHAEEVAREIAVLIDGRVEPATDPARRASWIENSKERVRHKRAPSWGDRKKKESARHNDCLIWRELLEIAARQAQPRPVVFVTSDMKDGSWIEEENGRPARAHRDLVAEMREVARVRFIVMSPADLMAYMRHAGATQVWRSDLGWGEDTQAGPVPPVQSFFPLVGDSSVVTDGVPGAGLWE